MWLLLFALLLFCITGGLLEVAGVGKGRSLKGCIDLSWRCMMKVTVSSFSKLSSFFSVL